MHLNIYIGGGRRWLCHRPGRNIVDIALYLAGLYSIWLINDLVACRRHKATVALLKDIRMELISIGLQGRTCHAERTHAVLERLGKEYPELAGRAARRA